MLNNLKLSPATRQAYGETLGGGLHREDARARAIEMLFERLAVSWTISEIETARQKELLARYRMATAPERRSSGRAARSRISFKGALCRKRRRRMFQKGIMLRPNRGVQRPGWRVRRREEAG